jgi:hypothetical protein
VLWAYVLHIDSPSRSFSEFGFMLAYMTATYIIMLTQSKPFDNV